MNLFKRLSILFFSLLILFGSGGWALTSHFCKAESSCGEMAEVSCCCGNEDEVPVPAGYELISGAGDACCVSSSTYFSIPLYRADVNHDFSSEIFHSPVILLPYNLFVAGQEYQFSLPHKPPLPQSGGVGFLALTGLFLI
jgi:hypothetical protein